jgi:hypothetical protein
VTADFDLIDHPLLSRIGDLKCRPTRVEDRDASVALVECLFIVLRLDDEAHLQHTTLSASAACRPPWRRRFL